MSAAQASALPASKPARVLRPNSAGRSGRASAAVPRQPPGAPRACGCRRSIAEQRVDHQRRARHQQPAAVLSALVEQVDGQRRADVDDAQRPPRVAAHARRASPPSGRRRAARSAA